MNIIVAHDLQGVIGNKGKLPWHLKEDLAHFSSLTTNNVVIMGYQTWLSLPDKFRPLPNRINIVLSTKNLDDRSYSKISQFPINADDVYHFDNLNGAVLFARAARKKIFVIGGEKVYAAFLNRGMVTKIYLTLVKGVYEGDRRFPALPSNTTWNTRQTADTEDFTRFEITKEIN